MRYDDDGSILHEFVQRLENQFFGSCVQARGRLVQDEDRRIANYGARDRDSLALTTRKRHSTFAQNSVIAFRQLIDKLTCVGKICRADDLLARSVRLAVGNVLPDRRMKQHRLLQHEADLLPKRFLAESFDIGSINLHDPGSRVVEARNQADDAGFAGPGWTYQRRHLSRFDAEAYVLEDGRILRIRKGNVIELNVPLETRSTDSATGILNLVVGFYYFANSLIADSRLGVCVRHLGKFLHGLVHFSEIQDEHHHLSCRKASTQDQPGAKPKHQARSCGHDQIDDRGQLRLQP